PALCTLPYTTLFRSTRELFRRELLGEVDRERGDVRDVEEHGRRQLAARSLLELTHQLDREDRVEAELEEAGARVDVVGIDLEERDRKSTRLNSSHQI